MNKALKFFVFSLLALSMASTPAIADITNGGFEDSTFNGWTTSGETSVTSAGFDSRTNNNLSTVAVGDHSARAGDPVARLLDGHSGNSSIQQTWTKTSTFDHLYFDWAAVALVPGEEAVPHDVAQTPWFQIKVLDLTTGGTLFSQQYYSGSYGHIVPGWLEGSHNTSGYSNDPGIWYYRPWDMFDLNLSSIADGDVLQVILSTRDCTLGGHASYAYLDGFGSIPQPPSVPEPSTLLLLGGGLVGLTGWKLRRK